MSTTSILSNFDHYLLGEGSHERTYEKLGAHLVEINGELGVHFAVWAPNARQVYLMGDFNEWHGESHLLSSSDSGIWNLFVPDLIENTVYKYRVVSQSGESFEKADPYGFAMEQRPRTASVVANLDRYQWSDAEWSPAIRWAVRIRGIDIPGCRYLQSSPLPSSERGCTLPAGRLLLFHCRPAA